MYVSNINMHVHPNLHCCNTKTLVNKHDLFEHVGKIKLMKGKALRKHSLHEKTAASVLLKLFISGNE